MGVSVPNLPEIQIDQVLTDLNTRGFASIPDFLQPCDLQRMQAFVHSAIERANHQYVGFSGPDQVAGSGLEDIYRSPNFIRFMRQIYERGTGKPAPEQEFYHVLRCLTGPSVQKHSLIFHYDSYVVTALIPIEIPTEGRAGDLLMFPNTRRIRSAYLFNAADKILLDNRLTQTLLRASIERKAVKPTRIQMTPGNLYLFWGYRSIHANEPCDPDKVRATALFHYANPHLRAN